MFHFRAQRDIFFLVNCISFDSCYKLQPYWQYHSLFYPFAGCHNHPLRYPVRYWTCTHAYTVVSPRLNETPIMVEVCSRDITQGWHSKLIKVGIQSWSLTTRLFSRPLVDLTRLFPQALPFYWYQKNCHLQDETISSCGWITCKIKTTVFGLQLLKVICRLLLVTGAYTGLQSIRWLQLYYRDALLSN